MIAVMIVSPLVSANVPSVKVTGPQEMGKDQSITLVIEVEHSGSDSGHYVEWVSLYIDNINGQIMYSDTVANWLYDSGNFVSDPSWTLTHEVGPPSTFDAYAEDYVVEYLVKVNCNVHGGDSGDTVTVRVKVVDEEGDDGEQDNDGTEGQDDESQDDGNGGKTALILLVVIILVLIVAGSVLVKRR
jgi:desulfoferrodoxin (superoxide reductase-like protein)